MRFILLLYILLVIQPSKVQAQNTAELLDVSYSLEIAPTSLIEALGIIRAQTGVRFIYSPSSLPKDQLVQIKANDQPLRLILTTLFEPLRVQYEIIGGQIALRWTPPTQRPAFTQTIRGRVIDQDSKTAIIGANVVVTSMHPIRGASTDENGNFEIPGLPVGRHTLVVQFIGFDSARISELLLTAGKEIVLDVELATSPISMEMVVVAEAPDLNVPLNQSAVVSTRSFSVEQTQRFAASISDPARMAQSFAGVSRSEDDLLNEVIVRGHSPKYTVWRLEGIEIPNPNHFGDDGHSSGGVNMLSANMLTYSDFLTGSFPAAYGNAIAGVFDMNLRKGNTSRPEYTIGVGALGLEGTVEGPFKKSYDGSYLVNYRYSTLGLMAKLNVIEQDVIEYQDLSFKVHLPTRKAGVFSFFGVGGLSRSAVFAIENSCKCIDPAPRDEDEEKESKGVVGLSHSLVLSQNTYLKSTLAGFGKREREGIYVIDTEISPNRIYADEEFSREKGLRTHITLNHKINQQHLLQIGLSGSLLWLDYAFRTRLDNPAGMWRYEVDARDHTANVVRGFGQWSYRYSPTFSIHAGFHAVRFSLNKELSIEPRLGLKWHLQNNQSISFGSGLYSQIEPYGIYLLDGGRADTPSQTQDQLRLSKSWHNVVAYEKQFARQTRFKSELYYDRGFDIPVNNSLEHSFSAINTYYLYTVFARTDALISKGTTTNYGVDITLEKFFSQGFYFLVTGSLFDARYQTLDGRTLPSRYNTRYMTNFLAGIEFKMGRRKKDVLGINARLVMGGGNRYTPISFEDFGQHGYGYVDPKLAYSRQLAPYRRVDFSFTYTMNRPYLTHSVYFDFQNLINQVNEGFVDFDVKKLAFSIDYQQGILPIFGYRLTF